MCNRNISSITNTENNSERMGKETSLSDIYNVYECVKNNRNNSKATTK